MRMLNLVVTLLAAATLAPGSALAATVLGVPGAAGQIGVQSDLNGEAVLAQSFTLAPGKYLLEGLRWWGNAFSEGGTSPTFHIALLGDDGAGGPGAALPGMTFDLTSETSGLTSSAAGFADGDGFAVTKFDWTGGGVFSTTGKVFVSIVGDYTDGSDTPNTFLWMSSDKAGDYFQRDTKLTSDWGLASMPEGASGPLAVRLRVTQLFSPVPEPGTWTLLLIGAGLAGIGLRRRARTLAPSAG